MSITITLSGTTSELTASYFPPIELKGDYECALVDFHTFNSIPNVDKNNNLFHIGDDIIELPVGSYELQDIASFIDEEYMFNNPNKEIEIEANNNTMQVVLNSSHDPIHFDEENSIGPLLGFKPQTLTSGEDHYSDQLINISKINLVRVECSLIVNTYMNNERVHTLHEFGINVAPGYKISEIPTNMIYLPVNCREVNTLTVRIVDQNGDLINFRGEEITLRIHLKPIT